MWRRAFWKTYWIAIQRSARDRRARSFAWRVTFLLLYIAAYLAYLVWAFSQPAAVFLIVPALGALLVRFLITRSNRRDDNLLEFSITGNTPQRPLENAESGPLRGYLAERLQIIGSLLARAGSEAYLSTHELPPGAEVVTRQNQNAFLRAHRLWEKLESAELALVTTQDGGWTIEQQGEAINWCEQLRLLRWIFGVDTEITSMEHSPKIDFRLYQGVLDQQELSIESAKAPTSADLIVQKEIAQAYVARTVAEMKARGIMPGSSELEAWAKELRAELGGPSTDLLAGVKTVGDLDADSLRLLAMTAIARYRYSGYLSDVLSAGIPFSFDSWLATQNHP